MSEKILISPSRPSLSGWCSRREECQETRCGTWGNSNSLRKGSQPPAMICQQPFQRRFLWECQFPLQMLGTCQAQTLQGSVHMVKVMYCTWSLYLVMNRGFPAVSWSCRNFEVCLFSKEASQTSPPARTWQVCCLSRWLLLPRISSVVAAFLTTQFVFQNVWFTRRPKSRIKRPF